MDPYGQSEVADAGVSAGADMAPDAAVPAAGPPSPPRRRMSRRSKVWWILGVALAVLIGATLTTMQITANTSFDAAAAAVRTADAAAQESLLSLHAVAQEAADTLAPAEAELGAASSVEGLVDVGARTAFGEALTSTQDAVTSAESVLANPARPASTAKPLWTWELLDAVPVLEESATALEVTADTAQTTQDTVQSSYDALLAASTVLYASVPPAAAALEAGNVSATTSSVLDFRDAAAAAAALSPRDATAVATLTAYAGAAGNLAQSAQAELAEKAGPLLGTRLEIEAYARSISGGVLLEFDWAPIVNGLGGSAGMAGTATWNTARGGFSTITLSNSVAEEWPSPDSRALVAHEVGHAITSKCSTMFDSDDQSANEAWATAWAISLGHAAEGNGTQAYGSPPQSLIDTAAQCR